MSESKAYARAMEEWLDKTPVEQIESIAEFSDTHEQWEEMKFFVEYAEGHHGIMARKIAMRFIHVYLEERAKPYLAARAQLIRGGSI